MDNILKRKTLVSTMVIACFQLMVVMIIFPRCDNTAGLNNFAKNTNTQANSKLALLRKEFVKVESKKVFVAAHRGDWRNAPENSIQAIENAIEMGVDIVEIDIRKTKDNRLVVIHDRTLDRTTTGSGKISDWTLDSLKLLFLKNGLGIPTKHKIPTLEEAMMVAKGNVLINLDKCYDYFDEVYAVLKKTKTIDHVLMKGKASYSEFSEKYPEVHGNVWYMPIVKLDNREYRSFISDFELEIKPRAYELVYKMDTASILKELDLFVSNGSRVWVNSLWSELCAGNDDDSALINPDSAYGNLIDAGFNIIQTDRPKLLLEYLRSHGRHD